MSDLKPEIEEVVTEPTDESTIDKSTAVNEATDEPSTSVDDNDSNEDTNESTDESSDESTPDSESTNEPDSESSDESDNDPDVANDAFVEEMSAKLTEVDPERYAGLVKQFQDGTPMSNEDYAWMAENLELPESVVRYGVALQRDAYVASQKVDNSLVEAEAEIGDIDELISFAKANAPSEQFEQWVSDQRAAQSLGERSSRFNDEAGVEAANLMTRNLLRDMKAFKDSVPGNRPKTMGHLASGTVTPAPSEPVVVKSDDTTVAESQGPQVDPQFASQLAAMESLSSQALANVLMNSKADPAIRLRADKILSDRGVI